MKKTYTYLLIIAIVISFVTISCEKDVVDIGDVTEYESSITFTIEGKTYTAGSDDCVVTLFSDGGVLVTGTTNEAEGELITMDLTGMDIIDGARSLCVSVERDENVGGYFYQCDSQSSLFNVWIYNDINEDWSGSYFGFSGYAIRTDYNTIEINGVVKKVNPLIRHSLPNFLEEEYSYTATLKVGNFFPTDGAVYSIEF